MYIIGIDVGGTFTDLICFDDVAGSIKSAKVPSTPREPDKAIITGLLQLELDPNQIRHVIHGTTVATNAVLERKGVTVGLITTKGFRDAIEIGRTQRLVAGGMFNPRFIRPAPLVPRSRRFEISERLLSDGSVHKPLQKHDVVAAAEKFQNAGVEAIAVCFLHSYRNPAHEQLAGKTLREVLPECFISLSSDIVPEYREFERFSTTVLNAYVSPIISRYLDALDRNLAAHGFATPIFTMSSNGGIMTSHRAGAMAILTVLSGPVGGVSGAIAGARTAGVKQLITCDMGGTSTDVCLVQNEIPLVTTEAILAGFPVRMPQVNINTVGAGGGSIAWFDGAKLQVGPRSAGADPGPACYDRGGIEPTVTDANLVLGRFDTERIFGGAIRLQPALAEKATRRLAEQLGGMDIHHLADGIVRLAVARMTSSIREISVQRGYDPADFVLVAFGGAGPMHATQVAEELGNRRVLIPRYPGNLSALGLLTSDLKQDYVRTYLTTLGDVDRSELVRQFTELEEIANRQLSADGVATGDAYTTRSLDLRYMGQAFELNITVPNERCELDAIRAAFHAHYLETYGRANEQEEVQIVNLRVAAHGRVPKPKHQPRIQAGTLESAKLGIHPVYFGNRPVNTPFYEREAIPATTCFLGPAVIEEDGSTTLVTPSWQAEIDTFGNIVLTRQAEIED